MVKAPLMEDHYVHCVLRVPTVSWSGSVKRRFEVGVDTTLTPPGTQYGATQGKAQKGNPLRSRIRTRKTDQRLDWQRGAGYFLRHVLQHLDLVFSTVGHTGYELSDQILRQCSDEELEAALTAIPGIGPWMVHGFLIIALDRPDVVLGGDLAIRRAVKKLYGLDHMATAQEVLQIAERWRPYRSLAVYYLFASESQI
jgi:hypothetical protein